jgi:hypothetical protein
MVLDHGDEPPGAGGPEDQVLNRFPWLITYIPVRKGFRSREEKSTVRSMERKRVFILGILVFLICCIIFMALWLAGRLG